jgi:hypothetical protein
MTTKQIIERLRVMVCDCENQDDIDTIWAAIKLLEGMAA